MELSISITIIDPTLPHTQTLIFLNGRGGTTQKFAQTLLYSTDSQNQSLPEAFPSFRFVFPGPKTPQWFNVYDPNNPSENEEVQVPGLKASVIAIRKLLKEVQLLNGKWERLVLAGFSQGNAVGIHTLLNLSIPSRGVDGVEIEGRLGAFLEFSCRLPLVSKYLLGMREVLGLEWEWGIEDAGAVGAL